MAKKRKTLTAKEIIENPAKAREEINYWAKEMSRIILEATGGKKAKPKKASD